MAGIFCTGERCFEFWDPLALQRDILANLAMGLMVALGFLLLWLAYKANAILAFAGPPDWKTYERMRRDIADRRKREEEEAAYMRREAVGGKCFMSYL